MSRFRPYFAGFAILLLAGCEKSSVRPVAVETKAPAPPPVEELVLPAEITFNEHIQPILSENCYACHGPDSGSRKPEKEPLRLDLEAEAFKPRESGAPVIVKGSPEKSELMDLVASKDSDEIMPPPESHKTLKPRQIALLERWISEGAEYEGHWAYQPVRRADPPANDWSEQPVDGFIYEKLAEAGLKPNPPENPRRFHRRLTFDLTGLPPEPAETAAFVAAYEKDADAAVSAEADRLLGTVASAEQLARHWLDAARYADTHGIHIDNFRSIWPYRDWVVQAFRTNMRWDDFTTAQLAGDLLEKPTLDQQIATGFNRCLATTGEGGAIPEEYDAIYARDRVDTTGAIWLGLTASCASCHDHKFDPFTTKEFYQLTAFFRNNTMSALDGNNANHPPSIFVPLLEDREKWAGFSSRFAEVDKRIAQRRESAKSDFETWLASTAANPQPQAADPTLAIHFPLSEAEGKPAGTVDGAAVEIPVVPERIDGPLGPAVVVSNADIELGNVGNFGRRDQISYGGFVWFEGEPTGAVVAKMDPAQGFRGWDLYLQGGRIGGHIIDTWPDAGNKLISQKPLEPGKWHHVMVTFDGSKPSGKSMAIYVDGKNQGGNYEARAVRQHLETDVPLRFGSRDGGDSKVSTKVALQDFRFYRRLLGPEEISAIVNRQKVSHWMSMPRDRRTPDQEAMLFDHFLTTEDQPTALLLKEKAAIQAEKNTMESRGTQTLVFEEKKDTKAIAHVLIRGVYSAQGDEVPAATPAMLPPMPDGAPANRLGLAMWLNDPANPLPARVTMNRLWSYYFGTGIVESIGDFGIMGARPSHPKLLDWLASEFVASGWDYRHMVKTIVTSRAYRQAESITPEKLEADPANRLISRGPRTRLEAEQLRDMALASAGILNRDVGGPPVKPYQPAGVWAAVAMKQSNTGNYKEDTGPALYRRSIYTFWKRTAAPPSMEILNAPNREVFCVRRDVTNTPLQALVLMNDPQFVEAGRVLAEKALAASPDFESRLDDISLRLLDRKLAPAERAHVRATLDSAANYYAAHPEDAKLAISTGETKAPETIPAADLAAWSLVASQLLNLDETLTR